jgi:hypothetical protein
MLIGFDFLAIGQPACRMAATDSWQALESFFMRSVSISMGEKQNKPFRVKPDALLLRVTCYALLHEKKRVTRSMLATATGFQERGA